MNNMSIKLSRSGVLNHISFFDNFKKAEVMVLYRLLVYNLENQDI